MKVPAINVPAGFAGELHPVEVFRNIDDVAEAIQTISDKCVADHPNGDYLKGFEIHNFPIDKLVWRGIDT